MTPATALTIIMLTFTTSDGTTFTNAMDFNNQLACIHAKRAMIKGMTEEQNPLIRIDCFDTVAEEMVEDWW
jgi:hypothetical protein